MNTDNQKNIRHERSRIFRKNKCQCLEDIIIEISFGDPYRGKNEFKHDCVPRTSQVNAENGDLIRTEF
jgi:hypothetical protein